MMPDIRSILILVASALVAYVQGQCSTQVPTNTGHYCFKYIKERMTYSKAVKRCAQSGAVVAHPAAQDFSTWVADVKAVTRNDRSLWVGTTRNGSKWSWLNTKYDGQPVALDYEGKHKGDISIPGSVWGIGSDHKCKDKNETTGNETMTNSTSTNSTSTEDQPNYCQDSEKNCAYLGKNGKLKAVDCESFEQFSVLCQGPTDYSSACFEEQNCSDNAYHYPISFNLCGCKCPSGYIGDGYNECDIDYPGINWGILGFVIGALIIVFCCCFGGRKQVTNKKKGTEAVKKNWVIPFMGICVGILIIIICL